MSREPSLTLDQAAMMCRNSEITQQHLRQFQKQRIEEEEVGYTRGHRQNCYQLRRNQTDESGRKRDNQKRKDFRTGRDKKASCRYSTRKGKYKSPENSPACGETCGKWGKNNHFAKVCKQKATTQLHQLEYLRKFIEQWVNIHYRRGNWERWTKKEATGGPYTDENKRQ